MPKTIDVNDTTKTDVIDAGITADGTIIEDGSIEISGPASQIQMVDDIDSPTKGASISSYVDPAYVGADFASNCYFDGTNWIKYDATKPAHSIYHDTANDRTSVWRSAVSESQDNPITNWSEHTILERDVANGIAALDANGDLQVKGEAILLTRDGSGYITVNERTSGEGVLRMRRYAANNYDLTIQSNGVYKTAIHTGYKNSTLGDGYAELVAAPATASSTGTAGQEAYDANYYYRCVATDTWVRVGLSTW